MAGGGMPIPPLYLYPWILISIILIFLPCIINRRLRRISFRRIRLLRWNVPTDDIDAEERERNSNNAGGNYMFNSSFTPRYSPGDPRFVMSKDMADQMTKDYISKRLEGFTKIIQESDFVTTSDVEMGSSAIYNHDEHDDDDDDLEQQATKGAVALKCPHAGMRDINNINITTKDDTDSSFTELDTSTSSEENSDHDGNDVSNDNNDLASNSIQPQTHSQSQPQLQLPVRHIRPECSICLNEYKIGEEMCWSPEKGCPHVFHRHCITEWLLTLGKGSVQCRRDSSIHFDFKMHCPVCRGDFICTDASADADADASANDDADAEASP